MWFSLSISVYRYVSFAPCFSSCFNFHFVCQLPIHPIYLVHCTISNGIYNQTNFLLHKTKNAINSMYTTPHFPFAVSLSHTNASHRTVELNRSHNSAHISHEISYLYFQYNTFKSVTSYNNKMNCEREREGRGKKKKARKRYNRMHGVNIPYTM